MDIISLEGMEFRAPVGCFEEEKIVHPRIVVDVYLSLNATQSMESDRLEHTVNYQQVYMLIKEIMQHKHNLIEHVAALIQQEILDKHDMIQTVRCKVSKMFPALGGQMTCVAFESSRQRS